MIKVIRQHHEVLGECPTDFELALRYIEKIARECYQSQDRITEDSYVKMVNMLVDRQHWAMLEHSNLVIKVRTRQAALDDSKFITRKNVNGVVHYAGNYRAYMEAVRYTQIEDVKNFFSAQVTENLPDWAKAVSVKFVTNRAMTHELVRHRPASFAQLSQRYVDHRSSMEFILPIRYYDKTHMNPKFDLWEDSCREAAMKYKALREYGESPQEARDVLPNSKSTNIVITAYLPEWRHIFKLRCASSADPTMQALMNPVRDEFGDRGWL